MCGHIGTGCGLYRAVGRVPDYAGAPSPTGPGDGVAPGPISSRPALNFDRSTPPEVVGSHAPFNGCIDEVVDSVESSFRVQVAQFGGDAADVIEGHHSMGLAHQVQHDSDGIRAVGAKAKGVEAVWRSLQRRAVEKRRGARLQVASER